MADLTLTAAPVDGGVSLDASAVAAAAGGDTAPTGDRRFLYVANGDTVAHTATVVTPGTVSGLDIADAALTVAAGEAGVLPLPRVFAAGDGRATVTYDDVTSVTVAVFELGR